MVIEVIVDFNSQQIDKTFDYLVPKCFEDIIEIGMRVILPFGIHSKKELLGFVVGIKETSEFVLKEINDCLDINPTLNKEIIDLGYFMSKETSSYIIQCFKTMLPDLLQVKYSKEIELVNKNNIDSKIEVLFDSNDKFILTKNFNEYLSLIKKEIVKGNLKINYIVKDKQKIKTIKKVRLLEFKSEVSSVKQMNVINFLKENNDIELNIIKKELKISQSPFENLFKKGIIDIYDSRVFRSLNTLKELKDKKVIFTNEQQLVYDKISKMYNEYNTHLIYGVTGSGKTEIYIKIIEDIVKLGKTAIMLVPEISLTPLIIHRFKSRFNDDVAVMHSNLSSGERFDEYTRIVNREAKIVIGARSAIFAPISNLGVIIIDEEHEESYKQFDNPKYHAVVIAQQRCKTHGIPLILGSATPSITSYTKALKQEYKFYEIKNRPFNYEMPIINIVDMRQELKNGNMKIFSRILQEKISEKLLRKEKIILLINRRGHSTFVICRECGYVIKCPNCNVSLTYHENKEVLKCHYCSHHEPISKICPKCGSKHIRYMGIGTERVETEILKIWSNAVVYRMDYDTTKNKNAHEKILFDFENNGDILVGTQMVAKGHDFGNVTLVGVLAADMSLFLPDFKSSEKTFQLLTQASGRAGRADKSGEVYLQTYNTTHNAIKSAANNDYLSFYNHEMNIRELGKYPPFYNLVQFVVKSTDYNLLFKESNKLVYILNRKIKDEKIILGPVMPKINKVNNFLIVQIILKYKKIDGLNKILEELVEVFSTSKVYVSIDKLPHLL